MNMYNIAHILERVKVIYRLFKKFTNKGYSLWSTDDFKKNLPCMYVHSNSNFTFHVVFFVFSNPPEYSN